MCFVSVVLITYNHEKYIVDAVESILNQKTDFEYEVLIGDDASSDNTPELLKALKQKYPDRITIVLRSENIGASANLFSLCCCAKGKYISTLEGDDFWINENKLQIQTEFLEKNKDFIGCCGNIKIVDENKKALENQFISWLAYKKVYSFKDFRGVYLPGQTGTLMYRNLFDSFSALLEIPEVHPQISDRTIVMLFSLKGNFFCFDDYFCCYRKINGGGENVTSTHYVNGTKTDYDITIKLSEIASRVKGKNISFRYRKQVICGNAFLKRIFRKSKDTSECLKYIIRKEGRVKFALFLPCAVICSVICRLNEKIKSRRYRKKRT